MVRIKRILCLVLAFAILTVGVNSFASESAEADYAYIDLGNISRAVNMTVKTTLPSVDVDGVKALSSDLAAWNLYVNCNISDEFLYDLPLYTPVDVTVEYLDRGTGHFMMSYDSHRAQSQFDPYETPGVWRSTDSVKLTDTGEWKTYTFHLEDALFKNRCTNTTDFRIGVWDPLVWQSNIDVIFKSIKVEKSQYTSLTENQGIEFSRLGNIFPIDENISFLLKEQNKIDRTVTAKYKLEYYSDISDKAYTSEKEESFEPNEAKDVAFELENPGEYAIYKMKITKKTYYADSSDEKYEDAMNTEFSVSILNASDEGNPDYGMCIHVIEHQEGELDETNSLVKNVGAKYIRDGYRWSTVEKEKGILKFDPAVKEKFKKMHNEGLEILYVCGFGNKLYMPMDTDAPSTDEQIAGYARYCAFVAKELKGIVDSFEIWNEYNYGVFNTTNEPPETYAKMAKAAYTAIKEVNPQATVVGVCCGGVYPEWVDRIFAAGAYDYMDAVSIHPYEYTNKFREFKYMDDLNNIKSIMEKYSNGKPVKPIWITEMGIHTATNRSGFSESDQAKKLLFNYALTKATGVADKYILYTIYDRNNPASTEDCWGIVRSGTSKVYPRISAKPSYLSIAAMNRFLGADAEIKGTVTDERFYAMNFYNRKMDKNILLLQSGEGEKSKTFNLGCKAIDTYDMYGNKTATLNSENGVYCLPITETPQYLIGNILDFGETNDKATVSTESTIVESTTDDEVEFNFTKNTDKNLTVNIIENDNVKVKENTGFINGKAKIVLSVKKAEIEDENIDFFVTDDSGKLYYSQKHTIIINPPTETVVTSEQAIEDDNNIWRARVSVTNKSNTKPQSGRVTLTEPAELVETAPIKRFDNIQPGETAEFLFNLPKRIVKQTLNLGIKTELENGYINENRSMLDFGVCTYAEKKPVIDGVISKDEWVGSWIGADTAADVKEITDWRGPSDLSFSCVTMWDEENFYCMSIVTDDIMSVTYSPQTSENMWKGDGIQFALDDRDYSYAMTIDSFTEMGLGQVPGTGDVVYRFKSLYSIPANQEVKNAQLKISRQDKYTIYECAIPWSEIFDADFAPKANQKLRFSVLVNDNDGAGRHGWIEYTSGIGTKKQADLFGSLKFVKNK